MDLAVHVIADGGWPVPDEMAEAFVRLHEKDLLSSAVADALKSATGFRNIAVHEYRSLDWSIVHDIAANHLDDFRKFILELKDTGVLPL